MLRIIVHDKNNTTYNAMNIKEDGQTGCTSKVYIKSNTKNFSILAGLFNGSMYV